MEAVVFIGIQGSGKSTFFRARFAQTHVHISLDVLKTRARERELVTSCLTSGRSFVVDNTNVTRADRVRYIEPAKKAGFAVRGYFFETSLSDALRRNKQRPGRAAIPVPGVVSAFKKLEAPTLAEGFDDLYVVSIGENGEFEIRAGAPQGSAA